MKLFRHGKLVVATHISGPTRNFLGLDFADDGHRYERDLASESSADPVNVESVRQQVSLAVQEYLSAYGVDPGVTGILYVSSDTPSDSVYRMMASEILERLSGLDDLDTFEPTWSPQ
jgi:hypothetical protein